MTAARLRRLLPLLAILLAPAPGHAQHALSAFQDSLAAVSQPERLLALRDAAPPRPDDAVSLVRSGLLELRLYELNGGEEHVERAGELMDRAVERAPEMAWAHLGHALGLIRGPELRIPSPFGILDRIVAGQVFAEAVGLDPRSRAWRALERALRLDPALTPAAVELGGLALGRPDRRDELEQARAALRTVVDAPDPDGDALLMLADVQAALGDLSASERAARVARVHGADPACADHALAVALLRQDGRAEEGERAYRAGIERLTPAAAERYGADVLPVLSEAERERWEQGSLEQRGALLTEIWEMRAALAGVTPAQRLAEHYRRLASATASYLRKSRRTVRPSGALQVEERDLRSRFDDRGLVLIRRGEPDDIVSTMGSDAEVPLNESWVYRSAGASPEVFHFFKPELASDFVLMSGVSCDRRWLEDRALLDPRLQPLLANCDEMRKAEVDADARQASYAALDGDRADPGFDDQLPFFYDVYTFRGRDGKTDVTAVIAVPGEMLRPVNEGSPAVYALDFSFILVDTLTHQVTRVDTVYRARAPRPLEKGEYLRAHIDLLAPPSAAAVHRIVLNDNRLVDTGESYGGTTAVRDYSGGALILSDIVLAELDGGNTWRRGGVELGLVAPQQFPDGAFTVFYEVYNLSPDAAYRTEIVVDRVNRGTLSRLGRFLGLGGGPVARLRFDGVAPDAARTVQEVRRITANLETGAYEIQVTVTDLETGERAVRTRRFLVPE